MQSTGKRNTLHISHTTHDYLLGDRQFQWEERETEVKGKGRMRTYILRHYSLDRTEQQYRYLIDAIPEGAAQALQCLEDAGGALSEPPSSSPSMREMSDMPRSGTRNHTVTSGSNSSGSAIQSLEGLRRDCFNTRDKMELRGMTLTWFMQNQHWRSKSDTTETEPSKDGGSGRRSMLSCSYWCLRGSMAWHDQLSQRMRPSPMMSQWVSFVAFCACYSVESVFVLFGRSAKGSILKGDLFQASLRGGYMLFALMGGALLRQAGKHHRWGTNTSSQPPPAFSDLIALSVFIGFVCSFLSNSRALSGDSQTFWTVFEGFFFVMVLTHLCRLQPQGVVPIMLCMLVVVAIVVYVAVKVDALLFECIAYSLFVCGTHLIATLGDPRWTMSDHKAICKEHERVNNLLDTLLPREVLAEMASGNLSTAYQYEDMTFLFADIVGFTRFCSEHPPEQAVNLVTRLFAEFDEQAVKLGVYKVCTIGDAYVVVNEPCMHSVTDKYNDCACVFSMAKWMLGIIVKVRAEIQHPDLDMRIGIHFGKFVGGVIGTKRLRFDIWGDDVLIGNDIESRGLPGQICVSEPAKEVLEHAAVGPLNFAFNQDIQLKGDRVMRMYVCTFVGGPGFTDVGQILR